jgi:hypothetical protein
MMKERHTVHLLSRCKFCQKRVKKAEQEARPICITGQKRFLLLQLSYGNTAGAEEIIGK